MKKLIASAAAVLMLLPVFSCGMSAPETASVTASAQETLVTDRLGAVPDGVVLGDAAVAAEYGIDMSEFENDGYILRTLGDTTLVFGKTEEGLDRACRAYVKAVEDGTAGSLDVTYHEGARIERLTIGGYDISEYTVCYPEDAGENMKFAAAELVRLIKAATGVSLQLQAGTATAPVISFSYSDDPLLGDDGYRYSVTEEGLLIEGAVKRGCSNGVWRFMQLECGWERLIYGDSYLCEAEHIDIPVGTERQETPAFEYLNLYNPFNSFVNGRATPTAAQNGYGVVTHACHGMQNNQFMYNPGGEAIDVMLQPCYTSEENYEICLRNVESYVAARYGDPAFKEVDIAQYDTSSYCFCESCTEMYIQEGGNAGAVVRFANRLSEELNETYPGIIYKIFGYAGTNVPPKEAVPNEYVYVTFCFDMNCSNHKVDGSECEGKMNLNGKNNKDYAEWFEGWCDITPNVYIWPYTLGTGISSYTVIDNIYDDYRYFAENDVRGIMLETEDFGNFSIRRVEHQLIAELNWNIDMTREEFDALTCRILEREYGDGWEYILDYIDEWELSQDLVPCWHCWGWSVQGFWADRRFDTGLFRERFDYFVELFESARAGACTKKQEAAVDRLYASMLYKGCYSSYYHAYLEGDTERMEVLGERYEECMDIARQYHADVENFPTIGTSDGYCIHYAPTIQGAAREDWIEKFTDITGEELPPL